MVIISPEELYTGSLTNENINSIASNFVLTRSSRILVNILDMEKLNIRHMRVRSSWNTHSIKTAKALLNECIFPSDGFIYKKRNNEYFEMFLARFNRNNKSITIECMHTPLYASSNNLAKKLEHIILQHIEQLILKINLIRILYAWRNHKTNLSKQPVNYIGVVSLMNKKTKEMFFIDYLNPGPYMRKPTKKIQTDVSGAFKTVKSCDDRNILLQLKKQGNFLMVKKFNKIAACLLRYKSVIRGRYVTYNEFVASYGGETISSKDCYSIKIKTFKTACKDLVNMHDNDIFLRDIKPDNMVQKNGGDIRHIDLDMVVTPEYGNPRDCNGTPGYVTHSLLKGRNSPILGFVFEALRRSDNYAMLKTMMYATLPTKYRSELFRGVDKINGVIIEKNGMMITDIIEDWVLYYIKPPHQSSVIDFLMKPATSKGIDLLDVINWEKNQMEFIDNLHTILGVVE